MSTFDLMPCGGLIVTAQDYRIKQVNRKLLQMLGYTEDYYIDESLLSLSMWAGTRVIASSLCGNDPSDNIIEVSSADNTHKYMTLTKVSAEDLLYIFMQDASYTMALETELSKVKSNLAEAQHLAKLGFWERNLLTGEFRWSENTESIYGIALPTTEEIKGLLHPDDLPKFEKRIADATVEGTVYELDYRITHHPSGTTKHIWSRVQARVDKEGNVVKRFGTVQDITERKLMERSLREIEEQRLAEQALAEGEARLRDQQAYFSAVINEAPVMVFVKNAEGEYTLANKALADHFGCSVDAILGKTDYDLCFSQEEAEAIWIKDQEVLHLTVPRVLFEESITRYTGEVRVFQTIKAPLLLPNGNRQIICVALDITEQKQAEEGRRISEARYTRLFETAKDGLLLLQYESGLIFDVNTSLLTMTGFLREDFVGYRGWECPAFQHLWQTQQALYQHLSKEGAPQLSLTRRDGHTLAVEFVNSFYTEAQERIVQCSIRDVTEKVRINTELARLDRLNVVGEMAASIAHEIRNPMTTVRGFLQFLGAKTEFAQHQYIMNLMIEELDRANNIITTYLSLARTSVNTTPCDLSALVESFAPILNADILMRDRNIIYELTATTPIPICEAEIKQLLANLVKNACEAMGSGGTVTVAVVENTSDICLSVGDEGSGVTKELLPRLGTPFLTTKDNGVGLGLAICYRIAERHNAAIKVDSSLQGSIFSICFPKD